MTQYWSMKTFVDWWNVFRSSNVIGIGQEGVNADYRTLSDPEIQQLLTNTALNDPYTDYKDRVFREFCKTMQIGDLVVVGTGQTTFSILRVWHGSRVTITITVNATHDICVPLSV